MKIEISLRGFSDKKGTNSKFQIQTDMKNQAGDTVANIVRQNGFITFSANENNRVAREM